LREEIVRCLALVEALIDFGEGEDIEEGVFDEGTWCGLSLSGVIDDQHMHSEATSAAFEG
jgi:tRNA modification GTPase